MDFIEEIKKLRGTPKDIVTGDYILIRNVALKHMEDKLEEIRRSIRSELYLLTFSCKHEHTTSIKHIDPDGPRIGNKCSNCDKILN